MSTPDAQQARRYQVEVHLLSLKQCIWPSAPTYLLRIQVGPSVDSLSREICYDVATRGSPRAINSWNLPTFCRHCLGPSNPCISLLAACISTCPQLTRQTITSHKSTDRRGCTTITLGPHPPTSRNRWSKSQPRKPRATNPHNKRSPISGLIDLAPESS